MKALFLLAVGVVVSGAFASAEAGREGTTCHQGYEYKMTRDSFGKSAWVPTGRRCSNR